MGVIIKSCKDLSNYSNILFDITGRTKLPESETSNNQNSVRILKIH